MKTTDILKAEIENFHFSSALPIENAGDYVYYNDILIDLSFVFILSLFKRH